MLAGEFTFVSLLLVRASEANLEVGQVGKIKATRSNAEVGMSAWPQGTP